MAVAERVRARSQSEEAYSRILERIVSLEMPPGSVVNEAQLREDLRIGRTPIREALQRLARENLVRSIPHRGTLVSTIERQRSGSSSRHMRRGLPQRRSRPPTARRWSSSSSWCGAATSPTSAT